MKSNSKKRLTNTFLSLIMALSLLPTSAPAVSADAGDDQTLPAAAADAGNDQTLLAVSADAGEDQTLLAASADTEDDKTSLAPIGPAFDVDSLLAWTAGSDEDGEYSRSVIPLAERGTGFTVNDTANPEAKLMVCSLANSKHDTTSS